MEASKYFWWEIKEATNKIIFFLRVAAAFKTFPSEIMS